MAELLTSSALKVVEKMVKGSSNQNYNNSSFFGMIDCRPVETVGCELRDDSGELGDEEFRLNKNNPDLKTRRFGGYTEFENSGLSISSHPW